MGSNDDYWINDYDRSPLHEQECACGCGNWFLPKRKDQRYLNSKHRHYHYNHTTRKEKHSERTKMEKQLRRNDHLLELFYSKGSKPVPLHLLTEKGFDNCCFTQCAVDKKSRVAYYHLYRYLFILTHQHQETLITIHKK